MLTPTSAYYFRSDFIPKNNFTLQKENTVLSRHYFGNTSALLNFKMFTLIFHLEQNLQGNL